MWISGAGLLTLGGVCAFLSHKVRTLQLMVLALQTQTQGISGMPTAKIVTISPPPTPIGAMQNTNWELVFMIFLLITGIGILALQIWKLLGKYNTKCTKGPRRGADTARVTQEALANAAASWMQGEVSINLSPESWGHD